MLYHRQTTNFIDNSIEAGILLGGNGLVNTRIYKNNNSYPDMRGFQMFHTTGPLRPGPSQSPILIWVQLRLAVIKNEIRDSVHDFQVICSVAGRQVKIKTNAHIKFPFIWRSLDDHSHTKKWMASFKLWKQRTWLPVPVTVSTPLEP